MESLIKKSGNFQKKEDGSKSFSGKGVRAESHTDLSSESRKSSGSSRSSCEEVKAKGSSSPAPLGWPIRNAHVSKCSVPDVGQAGLKQPNVDDSKLEKMSSQNSGLLCLVSKKISENNNFKI